MKMVFYSLRSAATCVLLGASIAVGGFSAAVASESAPVVAWPSVKSPVGKDSRIEARITALLRQLTLEQKVAQMVQADIRYLTPEEVGKYRIGSVLNGGGAFPANNKHATVADWVSLADRFYAASMDSSQG